ncbi:hypothetical protein Catovirus_1_936 [Catovirus CTV1]|uniref:Uncharacterized protein n=1 Tax=Catovirus CTV1 TaxID=1977631 RepID=A0A1V0SB09_9VIRU|nr:hypothetical protein Catovirus_1_936 [Catovirus CTV1]
MIYIISIFIPLIWLYFCNLFSKTKNHKKNEYISTIYNENHQFYLNYGLIFINLMAVFISCFISKNIVPYVLLFYCYIMMTDILVIIYFSNQLNTNNVTNKLIISILMLYATSILLI